MARTHKARQQDAIRSHIVAQTLQRPHTNTGSFKDIFGRIPSPWWDRKEECFQNTAHNSTSCFDLNINSSGIGIIYRRCATSACPSRPHPDAPPWGDEGGPRPPTPSTDGCELHRSPSFTQHTRQGRGDTRTESGFAHFKEVQRV